MADVVYNWRIRVAPDGTVLSAERIEAVPKITEIGIYYVTAADQERAEKKATKEHESRRMRERREQWRKDGKCTRCGRARDVEGRNWCGVCLRKKHDENVRSWRREKGEDVPAPKREETVAKRREYDADMIRLELLEELDAIWAQRGNAGLRKHLHDLLVALRQRRVA